MAIDPDGPGPGMAMRLYCDMERHGGGWAQVARLGERVTATERGALDVDALTGTLVEAGAPGSTEYAHWDLRRFDAYGSQWTIRVALDARNDGGHQQYTFYRPAAGMTLWPGTAGSNWLGTDTPSRVVYLVQSTTSGMRNTTWLAVPGWEPTGRETVQLLGYRRASLRNDCLTMEGQTVHCHAPAGGISNEMGQEGTFSAAFGQGDGVMHAWGRRATYWIRDTNTAETP